MKEYFPILSRYNTHANNEMVEILAGLPPEKLTEEVGSYFNSIFGLLGHLVNSDVAWLQRIRNSVPAIDSLNSPELDVTVPWPDGFLFDSFAELRRKRSALDSLFENLTSQLDDGLLGSVIDYTSFRGKRSRYILWQALMHVFNHQTHHRGQISLILDQLGVKNDFSNITLTLTEPPLP